MLPAEIKRLIEERGHLRNLEKLFSDKYPKEYAKLVRAFPLAVKFAERIFLALGGVRGQCEVCSGYTTFKNFVYGYKEWCSIQCVQNSDKTKEKRASSTFDRFGVRHSMQSAEVREKVKRTMLKNHGVEWALQSQEIRRRGAVTLLERHGVTHPTQIPGWTELMSSPEVHESRRRTWRKTLGVDNPQQHRETFERGQKTRMLRQRFTLEGKEFLAQGFEPYIVTELVKRLGFKARHILTTSEEGCKSSWYEIEGKRKRYHPDILVKSPHQHFYVEVKSTYTLYGNAEGINSIKRLKIKTKSLQKETGVDVWLAVVCLRTRRIEWIKNPHTLTEKAIRKQCEGMK